MDDLTFDNMGSLISTLSELALEKHNVFRGFSSKQELLPSLLRRDMVAYEKELLYEFERQSTQYLSVRNPLEFLSCAQHFGLSTRLLDFTWNPFVALFFAVYLPKASNDSEYYYIRYCEAEENLIFDHMPESKSLHFFETPSLADACINIFKDIDILFSGSESFEHYQNPLITTYEKYAEKYLSVAALHTGMASSTQGVLYENNLEKLKNNKLLFIDPNQANQRVVMQQGLFLFPYTLDKNVHMELIEKHTHLIKVHKGMRFKIKEYLSAIGVTSSRLMPDLQSICKSVELSVKEERQYLHCLFDDNTKQFYFYSSNGNAVLWTGTKKEALQKIVWLRKKHVDRKYIIMPEEAWQATLYCPFKEDFD